MATPINIAENIPTPGETDLPTAGPDTIGPVQSGDMTAQEEAEFQQQKNRVADQLSDAEKAAYAAAMAISDPVERGNLLANAQNLGAMAKSARAMDPRAVAAGQLGPLSFAAVAIIAQSTAERKEDQYAALGEAAENYAAAYGASDYAAAGYAYNPYQMDSVASQVYWAERASGAVDRVQERQNDKFYVDANGETRLKDSELSGTQVKDMTSLTTVDKQDVARDTEQRIQKLSESKALSAGAQEALRSYGSEIHARGDKQMLDEIAGSDYDKAAGRTWDRMSAEQKKLMGGDKDKFVKDFVEGQKNDEGAMTAAKAAEIKKAYEALPKDADPAVRAQMAKRATEADFYEKFLEQKQQLLKEGAKEQAVKDERVVAAVDSAVKQAEREGRTLSKEEIDKVIAEAKKIEKEDPSKAKEALQKAQERNDAPKDKSDNGKDKNETPEQEASAMAHPYEALVSGRFNLGYRDGGQHFSDGTELTSPSTKNPEHIAQQHQQRIENGSAIHT